MPALFAKGLTVLQNMPYWFFESIFKYIYSTISFSFVELSTNLLWKHSKEFNHKKIKIFLRVYSV